MGDEWSNKLSTTQYEVMRQRGTEPPFSGALLENNKDGTYVCAACSTPLFESGTKFDSGSGWPSFYDVVEKGNVELKDDDSHGMQRTEVVCATCGGHLGHVFDDGPQDKTGQRYCINSISLNFEPKDGSDMIRGDGQEE